MPRTPYSGIAFSQSKISGAKYLAFRPTPKYAYFVLKISADSMKGIMDLTAAELCQAYLIIVLVSAPSKAKSFRLEKSELTNGKLAEEIARTINLKIKVE